MTPRLLKETRGKSALEEENGRLQSLVAEQENAIGVLQDAIKKLQVKNFTKKYGPSLCLTAAGIFEPVGGLRL